MTTQSPTSMPISTPVTQNDRPPTDKIIGISLAVASGLFIGSSFVFKKKGLLNANAKYHEEAGEGYGYLKNALWWCGMTLMVIGEICNFVAYAYTDAIIVAPMGAISVVICATLSAIFLKERLSFVGKIACLLCILGSIIIPLNAPERAAVKDIQEMQHYVIAPGFLTYAGIIIVGCLFIALWVGPRYGKKSMFVYLSICSLIGGLSVVATQGLGSAIIAQGRGEQQFNQWFLYVLFFFVVGTLLTEIIYLNKALNIYNAAMVTPTYYVYFTSSTIVSSAVLFQGFGGTSVQIITIVLGFLTICCGVILLQMSNSAKDIPDAAVFSGDLDQMRTIAEQEQPESEIKADSLRGTAGIIRAVSKSRRKMEYEEALRILEDKRRDQLDPIGENEVVEWDGLRRRKTTLGSGRQPTLRSSGDAMTSHPPLGMSAFPDPEDEEATLSSHNDSAGGAFGFGFRRKSRRVCLSQPNPGANLEDHMLSLTTIDDTYRDKIQDFRDRNAQHNKVTTSTSQYDGSSELFRKTQDSHDDLEWQLRAGSDSLSHPEPLPMTAARRAFSFQNVWRGNTTTERTNMTSTSRHASRSYPSVNAKDSTEEERLGLVRVDAHTETLGDDDKEEDEIEKSTSRVFLLDNPIQPRDIISESQITVDEGSLLPTALSRGPKDSFTKS